MNNKIKDCKIDLLQKHISNHENIITMSMRVRILLSSCFRCNVYSWATPQVLQEVIIYQFAQNKPRDFTKIFLKPLTRRVCNCNVLKIWFKVFFSEIHTLLWGKFIITYTSIVWIFLLHFIMKFSNVCKIKELTFFLVVLLQSPLDNIARFVSSSRKKGLCGKCIAMRAHRN